MSGTGFWWIVLSVGLYGVLHSILAADRLKSLVRRLTGAAVYARFYRLFFVLIGAVTFLPSLFLVVWLSDQVIYSIPAPWDYLAVFIQGAALVGLFLGVLETGVMSFLGVQQVLQMNPLATSTSDKLVVTGMYRWVRHPLYTCALVFIWLVSPMTWNILALNLGVTAYLWIGSIFEERKLVQQFGKAYEEYRRRTPRILPWIKI